MSTNNPKPHKFKKITITNLASQHGWIVLIFSTCLYFAYTQLILQHSDIIHYLGISAYMKSSHQYLFTSNYKGNLYSEKPPLFFWTICLGWKLLGVSLWWPQVLSGIWISTWVVLTKTIYSKIFPDDHQGTTLLPWIMIASIGTLCYLETYRVDHLLITAILLFIYAFICCSTAATPVQIEHRNPQYRYYLIITGSTMLGVMSKGPIFFIWTLFPCLGLLFNTTNKKLILTTFLLSLLGLLIIAGLWGVPVILHTPSAYWKDLLWGSFIRHANNHSNWHQRLNVFNQGFLFYLLPWSLSFIFIKQLFTCVKEIARLNKLLLLLFIPFLILTYKGNMAWHVAPILPFTFIILTRHLVNFQHNKTVNTFFSIIFSIIFITIALIVFYKCYIIPSPENHFLFHGKINRPFFSILSILNLATSYSAIKNKKNLLRYIPLYSFIFFLSYTSIQGYGSQQVLLHSKRNTFLHLLHSQINSQQPIIFLKKPITKHFSSSEPQFIFSGINLVELNLKKTYRHSVILSPPELPAFIEKHPQSLLITNLSTSQCPKGWSQILKLQSYKVYASTILLCKKNNNQGTSNTLNSNFYYYSTTV